VNRDFFKLLTHGVNHAFYTKMALTWSHPNNGKVTNMILINTKYVPGITYYQIITITKYCMTHLP